MRQIAQDELVRVEEAARTHDPVTAPALVGVLLHEIERDDAGRTRALYRLQLESVADPELRPVLRAWSEATVRTVAVALESLGSTSPQADARLLVTAVDGLRPDALTATSDDELVRPRSSAWWH